MIFFFCHVGFTFFSFDYFFPDESVCMTTADETDGVFAGGCEKTYSIYLLHFCDLGCAFFFPVFLFIESPEKL